MIGGLSGMLDARYSKYGVGVIVIRTALLTRLTACVPFGV